MKVYNVAEHLPTGLRSLLPSEVVGGGLGTAPISTDTLTYPIWTIALSICINNPSLDLYTGQSGPRPQAFPVFCHQGLTTFPTILMERDYKLTFEEFFSGPMVSSPRNIKPNLSLQESLVGAINQLKQKLKLV